MVLTKEHWVGGNLTFSGPPSFGPPSLSTKKVDLLFYGSQESSSVVCFILFRSQETKLDEKGAPWSLLWHF